MELFAIPLTAATALVILRYGALPRWLAWVSLAVALIMAIPPIAFFGLVLGLPLWTLLTSVLVYRSEGEPAVAGPPPELR